jgi:hypothetical protein
MSDTEARSVRLAKELSKLQLENVQGFKDQVAVEESYRRRAVHELSNGGFGVALNPFGHALEDKINNLKERDRKEAEGRVRDPLADEAALQASALAGEISALESKLNKEIGAFGLSGDEITRWTLTQKQASDAVLANVDALLEQKRQLDETKSRYAFADKVISDTESPLSKAQTDLERLNREHDAGTIGADSHALAVGKLAKQFIQLGTSTQLAGANTIDSAAGFSAFAQHEARGKQGDTGEQVARGIAIQTEIDKQALIVATQILDAIRQNGVIAFK